MKTKYQTLSMAAASANAICTSQSPGAAGALTINGSLAQTVWDHSTIPKTQVTVAVLDVPRHVAIASAGNDSGKTFVVTGTDRAGHPLTESVTGPNATSVSTVNNFATVTSITISAASAGAITVGTNSAVDLGWIPLDHWRPTFNVGLQGKVTGTLTWGVQYTIDNVQDPSFREGSATTFDHAVVTGKTTDYYGSITVPVTAVRAKIIGYSSGATFTFAVAQQ